MNRASDVPPEVEISVFTHDASAIAFTTRSTNGPRFVRYESLAGAQSILKRVRFAAFFSRFSISFFRREGVCLSLKRMLNRAVACAGMMLNAAFPASTETISRFDG